MTRVLGRGRAAHGLEFSVDLRCGGALGEHSDSNPFHMPSDMLASGQELGCLEAKAIEVIGSRKKVLLTFPLLSFMMDMGRLESARLARVWGSPTVGMITEGPKLTDGWPDSDAVFRRAGWVSGGISLDKLSRGHV